MMSKSLLLALGLGIAAVGGAHAAATVPFVETFDNLTALPAGWVATDLNNDGKTWSVSYSQVTIEGDYFTTISLDDWLFTPAVTLQAGKTYVVEFQCTKGYSQNNANPTLEVKYGAGQTPASMTSTLLAPTVQDQYFAQDSQRFVITPTATGDVTFGFHATGEDLGGIKLDNVVIKEATMPAAPEISVAAPATYGDNKVQVTIKAPAKTVGGQPLAALSKIEVVRSGIPVKTLTEVTPGQTITFEDVCAYGSGNYQWKATAYDANGDAGLTAESKVMFVGINVPAAPSNVKAVEDGNSGMVTLSWDPVTTDRDGVAMPSEFIDYQVIYNGEYLVPTGATSPYTFKACEPDEQAFASIVVSAKSTYGSGSTPVGTFIVGKPYTAYHESFNEGMTGHEFLPFTDVEKPAQLMIYDDDTMAMSLGIMDGDADGTHGCAAVISQYTGYSAGMNIGKFNVTDIENPVLAFYTHYFPVTEGVNMKNVITVEADCGQGYETLETYDMASHNGLEGWQRVIVPLSKYKGKDVSIRLKGTIINTPYVLFDDINILNLKDKNLAVTSLVAPASVTPDSRFLVTAKIGNIGVLASTPAVAKLMLNGQVIDQKDVEALEPGQYATLTFSQKLSLLHTEGAVYSLTLEYADDQDLSDNTATPVEVTNLLPKFPAVDDLAAVKTDKAAVALSWSAPSGELLPEPVVESFEDGTDFAIDSFGDWTFVDRDKANTLKVDSYDPIPGEGSPMAAIILNGTDHSTPYKARTGNKALAMFAAEDNSTDDWAISPRLSGESQTVTFYARSYDAYGYFKERFEFLTSTTGNAPEDFTPVTSSQPTNAVPGNAWTEFSFPLPEGTTYFAIHYTTPSVGMMIIFDDFAFTPAVTAQPVLQGYNVYRDGNKLNDAPVAETAFAEANLEPGDHTYHVTALYDLGESKGSNAASVQVEASLASVQIAGLKAVGADGSIELSAAQPTEVTIVAPNGTTVARTTVSGNASIPALPGIYIVATAEAAVKVAVR